MLEALLKYPETLAHWIVALPFLSFVFITLKLTINKNVDPKPKDESEKELSPDLKKLQTSVMQGYMWPIIALVGLLGFLFLKSRLGEAAGGISINSVIMPVIWIVLLVAIFWPTNSRHWIQKYAPYISVGAMAIGAIIATSLWIKTVQEGLYPGHATPDTEIWKEAWKINWYGIGDFTLPIGIKLDGFAIFGVWMVTVVAMCIQWFSIGYIWDDDYGRKHFGRYFAKHSLFATGMLMVVLSDNILTFLIGWEVMGLCSYLLIGFFTYKPSANAAQIKAFITTRIGDVGFMLGIFMLGLMFTYANDPTLPFSFDFEHIKEVLYKYDWAKANLGWLPTAAALLIFMGAVGKSAQFPLHVWLPDAMEGPTPVSALIHAATMVAAGVFLVVRFFWLFEMSPTAMLTVAWIGAITAFGAATIGVVQYDIKRILAYSTISQLGYMMIGLGVGSATAGMFHLLTHAYFKALLFLGSGAVIYGCRHIQDIRYMGGLSKRMPITYWTFLAGTLALAGIFPFAGFWSKDEILASVFHMAQHGYSRIVGHGEHAESILMIPAHWSFYIIFILGIAGAFLTAFYMFRLIAYTFLGRHKNYEYRGEQSPDYGHHAHGEDNTEAYDKWTVPPGPLEKEEHDLGHPVEPREVPPSMWIPLVILAIFATVYGFMGTPLFGEGGNLIAKFLNHGYPHYPELDWLTAGLMGSSLLIALLGVHFGLKINNTEAGAVWKDNLKAKYAGLYRAVYNKYFVDEFYEEYIIQPVFFVAQMARAFDTYIVDGIVNAAGWLTYMIAKLHGWWDNVVIDGFVNGLAWIVGFFSDLTKPIQSGYVQNYMMVIIIFVLFYLLSLFIR